VIRRASGDAAGRQHDLIVVGGGIYGACVALEAARRGLRPLLLERGDFGEATSWNSLRLLHGGLRYLQTLDLQRFRQSVAERRWFCLTFPDLVRPQPCVMPLYGEGMRRPLVLDAALRLNDALSRHRNVGVAPGQHIGRGRVLDAGETIAVAPHLDRRGLKGAAFWTDAAMSSPQRILIEILRWACHLGATALNYTEAVALVLDGGAVRGIEARDVLDGRTFTVGAPVVCNCAGPWSTVVASRFDRPIPSLFRPSLAFNVLLDREPPSSYALAVTPRRTRGSSPTYFMYPALGGLLAGTAHLPWTGDVDLPVVRDEDVDRLLADLNASVPGLAARPAHVRRVLAGLLPATDEGTSTLAVRPAIVNHWHGGGPKGLISVAGVKFTTARLVAQRALDAVGGQFQNRPVRHDAARPPASTALDWTAPPPRTFSSESARGLRRMVAEEAVVTVDDLLFRRTEWGLLTDDLDALRARTAEALGWGTTTVHGDRAGAGRRSREVSA
jgi:glycerol-3-phosphate dehydrogenase